MTLSGGSEHPRERGAGILTAQLRSHALTQSSFVLSENRAEKLGGFKRVLNL